MTERNTGNSSTVKTPEVHRKIIDLLREKLLRKEFFFSIEVSPCDEPLDFAFDHQPLFVGITWIRDNNLIAFRRDPNACPALQMLQDVRQNFPVLSHLTCFNMTSQDMEGILRTGMPENIFALRGDISGTFPDYKSAADLVAWLRHRLPDATIAVAGYPATHFLATSPDDDLRNLREKVNAGADFIITQFTFSASQLIDFVRKCRSVGIKAQFLPGVLVPPSFANLLWVTQLARVTLDEELWGQFKALKDDEESFQAMSLDVAEKWMRDVLKGCPEEFSGFHIFTWNNLGMVRKLIKRFNFS